MKCPAALVAMVAVVAVTGSGQLGKPHGHI